MSSDEEQTSLLNNRASYHGQSHWNRLKKSTMVIYITKHYIKKKLKIIFVEKRLFVLCVYFQF